MAANQNLHSWLIVNCRNELQNNWLTYYGSQSELAQLAHRKLSERTSKQTLELCNEHSELCNEHSELTNEHSK